MAGRAKGSRSGQGPGTGSLLLALVLAGFVVSVHLLTAGESTRSSRTDSEWIRFKAEYGIASFGEDGYFVRAVKNGYHLFFDTYRYAWRFTRRRAEDVIRACADCHTAGDLAYAFVNADRFDPALGKRVSFEERLMRCYADPARMDGFVPTIYDPAIRDLRILARALAHHLQLSEGEQPPLALGPARTGPGGMP